MNIKKILLTVLVLIVLTIPAQVQEADGWGSANPLGFKFGMTEDNALKVIKSNNKKVLDNEVDSKEIRTIMIDGTLIGDLPAHADSGDIQTKLEFYDEELVSSALILTPDDTSSRSELEAELTEFFSYLYGEPVEKEKFLYFNATTWYIPDIKLVLSGNQKEDSVKVQYTYEPGIQARREEEINRALKGEPDDPAKSMFLEGDYSTPTRYKE